MAATETNNFRKEANRRLKLLSCRKKEETGLRDLLLKAAMLKFSMLKKTISEIEKHVK
jgi:hypothetical protein